MKADLATAERAASRTEAGAPCGGAARESDLTFVSIRAPWPTPAGAFAFLEEVNPMFEGQPQHELDALMKSDPEFRQLYHRHRELDKQVLDAELGVLPLDDTTLARMKKEKLNAKDRLTRMFDQRRH
jgi:uncharacterized protein YdcH (DUF465 family)